jgi:hypothetical protein
MSFSIREAIGPISDPSRLDSYLTNSGRMELGDLHSHRNIIRLGATGEDVCACLVIWPAEHPPAWDGPMLSIASSLVEAQTQRRAPG